MPRVDPAKSPVTPAEKAPDPDLGTAPIEASRYTSAEFMRLEWEHLWTKVWLLGGLECDIPDAGDFIVTDIGRESVMLVRQADGGVRALLQCLPASRQSAR